MLHVILSTFVQWPSMEVQESCCRDAQAMSSLNLPANKSSAHMEITHASVVYVDNRFVGFLYATRAGLEYLHLGQVGKASNISPDDQNTAARVLGAKPISGFQLLQLRQAPLMQINLMSCY